MRFYTTSHRWLGQHVDTHTTRNPAEWTLAVGVAALALLATLLPATALPAGYHEFADQRMLLALPHAMNVLSNLPFALMGAWGMWVLCQRPRGGIGKAQRVLVALFFAGLGLTALCSSVYHLAPDHAGLCVDRIGMSLAFAGLLGLAAADRISARAGLALAAVVGIAPPATALIDGLAGNMTPWAVLQGGGLVLLAALAWRRPVSGALGFSIIAAIAAYAVAKALELADAPVFVLTNGIVSGHSLKHLVAALAAWPVVWALHRRANKPSAAGPTVTMR